MSIFGGFIRWFKRSPEEKETIEKEVRLEDVQNDKEEIAFEKKQTEITNTQRTADNNQSDKCTVPDVVVQPVVIIDLDKYNENDIFSTLKYAIEKYGEEICKDGHRLKNILRDMSPTLGQEIKLISLLCNEGFTSEIVLKAPQWNENDAMLWSNRAVAFLNEQELIDRVFASDFSKSFVMEFSGIDLITAELEAAKREQLEKEAARQEEVEKEVARRLQLKVEEDRKKEFAIAQGKMSGSHIDVEKQLKRENIERKKAENVNPKKPLSNRELMQMMDEMMRSLEQINQRAVEKTYNVTAKTASELYNQYKDIEENVIIKATGWTGDFCFVVDEIIRSGGRLKARGKCYKDGMFYKSYTYPADDDNYLFTLYSGPSKGKINRTHVSRDGFASSGQSKKSQTAMVFKDGRTLQAFFKNNGFEVIDKRDKGGNLWVVGEKQQLDPYIEKARTKFGETCVGEFGAGRSTGYRTGWFTRCNK